MNCNSCGKLTTYPTGTLKKRRELGLCPRCYLIRSRQFDGPQGHLEVPTTTTSSRQAIAVAERDYCGTYQE